MAVFAVTVCSCFTTCVGTQLPSTLAVTLELLRIILKIVSVVSVGVSVVIEAVSVASAGVSVVKYLNCFPV